MAIRKLNVVSFLMKWRPSRMSWIGRVRDVLTWGGKRNLKVTAAMTRKPIPAT